MRAARRTPLLTLLLACAALAGAQEREWRDVQQTITIHLDGTVSVRDYRTLHADEGVMEAYICIELEPEMRLTLREDPIFPQEVYTQRCAEGRGTEIVIRNETPRTNGRYYFEYELEGTLNAYSDTIEWRWPMLEPDHYPVDGYQLTINLPEEVDGVFATHVQPGTARGWTLLEKPEYKTWQEWIPAGEGLEARVLMDPYRFSIRGEGERFNDLVREIGPVPFGPHGDVLLPAGTLLFTIRQCASFGTGGAWEEETTAALQTFVSGAFAGFCGYSATTEEDREAYLQGVEDAYTAAGYRVADRGFVVQGMQHIKFDHPVWDHYVRVFRYPGDASETFLIIGVFPNF